MTANGVSNTVLSRADLPCDQANGGAHGTGVQSRADIHGSCAAADREVAVSRDNRGRDSRDALDRVRHFDAPVQPGVDGGLVSDTALTGLPAVQSPEAGGSQSRSP